MSAQPLADLVIRLKLDGSSLGPDAQRLGGDIGAVSAPAEAAAASIGVVDRAAQKFMQTLQGESQALKDEAATFGMTRTELLAYQAAKLGVADAAAPLIGQLAQEQSALKALRDSVANASVSVNAFGETEAEAAARISDMVARSREAQSAMGGTASAAGQGAAGMSAFGASSEQVRATIAAQTAAMSATGREMASLNEVMEAFHAGARQGSASFQDLYAQFDRVDLLMAKGKLTMEEYDAATAALWKDEDRLLQQVSALTARYDPLDAATRKLAADQALLDDAYRNGQVTTAQYQKAMAGIQADQAAVQLRALAQEEAQLERALKSGQVSWSDYKKSLSDINASKAGLSEIASGATSGSKAMDSLGLHTVGARKELVVLAHEVATGSWSNLGGSLMVMAERMDIIEALTSPLALGFTAAAVAATAFAVAAYKGYEESEHLGRALASTGNYAGVTAGQVDDMAQRIGASNGAVTEAQKALAGLVSSGKVSGSALESVGAAAVAMSEATGENVDKVVAQFVAMSDDVAKGAEKMNEQYHFLTLAQYDEIKALEEHGDKAAAMKLAADALTTSLENQKLPLGTLPQLLKDAGKAWSDFWRSAMNAGKPETPADAVNTARAAVEDFQQQIDGLKSAGVTPNADVMGHLASLQQDLSTAGQEAAQHADSAGIQGMLAQQQADGIAASKHIDELKKSLRSREQIRDDEIASIRKYYADARAAAQANPDQLDPANYSTGTENAAVAAAMAKNKGSASNAQATGNRDVASLKAEIAAQEQQLALLDQYNVANAKITDGDKKVLQIEQQLGLAQKDRIGKVTDAQLREQLGLAQTLAGLEREVQARKNAADATKAYNGALDKWADSEQGALDALDEERDLVDQGAESQKLLQIQLQAVADTRALILKQQKDGKPLSEEERQSLLALAAAHGKVMASLTGESDALKAATQLQQENEKFAANSIVDETQRNNALVAIDAKKWQDLIANAGDGTDAQKKLVEQYDQWLSNQYDKPLVDQWKKTIDGIGTDFHDGFLQMLENGKGSWDSFTKSLKNTFETAVVDEIYREFAKPFIVNVVAQLAGVVSGQSVQNALLGNGANGGGGVANLLSNPYGTYNNLSNAYNTVAGWIQGYGGASTALGSAAIAGAGSGALSAGGATLGGLSGAIGGDIAASAGSYGAALGANAYGFTAGGASTGLGLGGTLGSSAGLMYGGAGLLGGLAGGALFGNKGYSSVGGSLGAMGGMALGASTAFAGTALGAELGSFAGPVGAVIGMGLGAALGSLFGGGETRYGTVYTSDGTNDTKVSAPSGGDPGADQVKQQINSTFQTIQSLASQLGGSLDGLGTYTAGYEVSPKKGNSFVVAGFQDNPSQNGAGRQDLKGVKDTQTVLDDLSLQLQRSVISSLQQAHLDKPYADYLGQFDASTLTADQITSIEANLNTMASLFKAISAMGPDFDNLKQVSTEAQLAVVNLAGGIDSFNSSASYFYQHFTSAAQQADDAAKALSGQLDALGYGSVHTRDQFRDLVESLDLSTDAGQKAYIALLNLAPAFDTVVSSYEAAVKSAYDTQSQALSSFKTQVDQFRTSLASGQYSTASPEQQYADTQQRFEDMYGKAMSGDADAQSGLTSAAQDFLTASKAYNASSGQYQADLTEVMQAMDYASSSADAQLDQLKAMVQGIVDVNDSVQTVTQAIAALQGWTSVNGSHAGGLYRVPYDGYIAELHQGERVLTADEAKAFDALPASLPVSSPAANLTRYQSRDNDALITEIRSLRSEVAQLRAERRQADVGHATQRAQIAKQQSDDLEAQTSLMRSRARPGK